MKSDNLSVELDESFIKELDRLAELEGSERELLFREVINRGLEDLKMDLAVKAFSKKDATISEAAEIAGISVGEMMEELTKRGLESEIDEESLKESLKNARKAMKS